MRVLIAGGGGREHALAWRLAREPGVTALFCAPGNAGIAAVADVVPIESRRSECAPRARRARRDRSHRHRTRAAARSRRRRSASAPPAGVSSARRAPPRSSSAARCSRRASWRATAFRPRAIASARRRPRRAPPIASGEFGFPVVLKADGLAAGKGVVVAADARGSRSGDPRRDGRAAVRRRRRAARHRGMPRRSGSVVLRALRRHARDPDHVGAGSQAHLRRRPRVRTPAAWGRSRRARCSTPSMQARVMREHRRSGAARHARRRHRVPRIPLCRPDDDLRRARR